MYKTILVPIDMSQARKGEAMLDLARKLRDKNGRIVLITVIEDVPAHIAEQLPEGIIKKTETNARTRLEDMAKAANLSAEVVVRDGYAPTAILDVAKEKDAELIIVASHKPELRDYLLGSTAARVVRHAECSVLVVR